MGVFFDVSKIEIRIKINQKNSMIAQVELLYSELHIYGYRVMRSEFEDGLYIQPPSVRVGLGYKEIVRIEDAEKWKQLESMIKNAFLTEVARYNANISGDVEHKIELPKKKPSAEELLDEMMNEGSL